MPCSCEGHSESALLATTLAPLTDPFPSPDYPPREWFVEIPAWLGSDTKITVDDSGRVAGWFYHDGQCLVHNHDACPRPSPTGYRAFHQNDVVLADGETLRVGVIGDVGGHADPYAPVGTAMRHYADPSRQKVLARAYDVELPDGTKGGVILGSVVPGLTYADVALVRRSALSGDWRPMPAAWWTANGIQASVVRACDGFDCIGPTLVNRAGLPLPNRQQIIVYQASAGAPAAMLGGVGGVELPEEVMAPKTTIEVDGVVVTREGGVPTSATPGPVPATDVAVEAVLASTEPVGSSTGGAGNTDARLQQVEARLAAIETRIEAEDAAELAAIEASVEPLP